VRGAVDQSFAHVGGGLGDLTHQIAYQRHIASPSPRDPSAFVLSNSSISDGAGVPRAKSRSSGPVQCGCPDASVRTRSVCTRRFRPILPAMDLPARQPRNDRSLRPGARFTLLAHSLFLLGFSLSGVYVNIFLFRVG